MAYENMDDHTLLRKIRDFDFTETSWNDYNGDIAGAYMDSLLDEAKRRGLKW